MKSIKLCLSKKLNIIVLLCLILTLLMTGCTDGREEVIISDSSIVKADESFDNSGALYDEEENDDGNEAEFNLMDKEPIEIVDNQYAKLFTIERYEGGYSCIKVDDGRNYLIVPEGMRVPDDMSDCIIINKGCDRIYLAGTAAMSLFDAAIGLDYIKFSSLKAEDWYVDGAVKAMNNGDIVFAGKYSAPDFELLLKENASLALESTMILHKPDILEKLEEVGIPVFIERSSYENHPLGRLEWIKVYGEICGREGQAKDYFDKQCEVVNNLNFDNLEEKTVAFFYINDNGCVITKKSSDYIPKMIAMAGGKYIYESLGDEDGSATSSVNMTMEEFYSTAKDADFIIYNATIQNAPKDLDSLISTWPLLKDFKGLKDGNVYVMTKSVYQATSETGTIIEAINDMLCGKENEMIKKL